jgi:hypothetical protein
MMKALLIREQEARRVEPMFDMMDSLVEPVVLPTARPEANTSQCR